MKDCNCGADACIGSEKLIEGWQCWRERKAILEFVARVNARAEAEMLAGRPVTGAHHRALEAEVAWLGGSGVR